jgi:WXG100 family type VII secretion target
MTTVQIDHEAFDRATQMIADLSDALRREHESVADEVADLLSSRWNGVASEQFGDGWKQWCRGMDDLLGAITTQNTLIRGVRADLDRTDAAREAAALQLHQRLGGA